MCTSEIRRGFVSVNLRKHFFKASYVGKVRTMSLRLWKNKQKYSVLISNSVDTKTILRQKKKIFTLWYNTRKKVLQEQKMGG